MKIFLCIIFLIALIEPFATVVNFTFFKNYGIIYSIIILHLCFFPLLFTFNIRRIAELTSLNAIVSFMLIAYSAITIIYIIFSSNKFESIVYSTRALSSISIFLISSIIFCDIFSEKNVYLRNYLQNVFTHISVYGLLLGIIIYFVAVQFDYRMTHSITSMYAVPFLIYMAFQGGIFEKVFSVIMIFLSGKSSVLICFFSVLTVKYVLQKFFIALLILSILLVIFSNFSIDIYSILPSKLQIRILLFTEFLSDSGNYEILDKLSSSRISEIIYVFRQFEDAGPIRLFFGFGTDSTIDIGIEKGSVSTVHFSHLKLFFSTGIFSLFIIIPQIVGIYISIKYFLLRSDSNKLIAIFHIFVIYGPIISLFQFTIFQNPLYWISLAIVSQNLKYNHKNY